MNVNHTQSFYTTLRTMNPAQYYKLSSLKQLQEDYKTLGHRKFLELTPSETSNDYVYWREP